MFLVNNNLLPPHICVVGLFKTQEHGTLDPYLVTISCSPGACYKLQQLQPALSSHSLGDWTPITLARGVTLQYLLPLQL